MNTPGYETLASVLSRAYDQAAIGKGKERHANDQPFDKQVMQTGAQRFGHGALLFQAFKKSEESQRLPHDAAVRELLGAIVYLAGAVIALEALQPANDNGEWIYLFEGCKNPAPGMFVEYKMRDGKAPLTEKSDLLRWTQDEPNTCHQADVVAYRIIGPYK